MWLERFFELIDKSPIGNFVKKRRELLENTDPNRIYVENIRAFFNIPTRLARWLCNLAVNEGSFEHYYVVICPNEECERVIVEVAENEKVPTQIACEVCEGLGRDPYEFPGSGCMVMDAYRLAK